MNMHGGEMHIGNVGHKRVVTRDLKVFQNAVINVGFEVSACNLILEGSLLKAVPEDEIQKTEFRHYMSQRGG